MSTISKFGKPLSECARLIDEWVFNERDRQILKRRYLDGITIEALAEEFDISVSQTKRIIKNSTPVLLEKMSEKIK